MGFFDSLVYLFDPIFRPLLEYTTPFWSLFIISIAIALFMTLIYKWTTNQSLMKDLKDELNAVQKQLKELRNQPEKMMEVQKKAMETNMKYMMHSMRSTLFTFIPIIIIFAWLNANLAFEPIIPNQDFTTTIEFQDAAQGIITLKGITGPDERGVALLSEKNVEISDGNAIWKLKAKEPGLYNIDYELDGKVYTKEVLISTEQMYSTPEKVINDNNIKSIKVDYNPLRFNILGIKLSWLWTYIIVSIVFSMLFRKLFKVY